VGEGEEKKNKKRKVRGLGKLEERGKRSCVELEKEISKVK
jgi:hypothetical protein